MAIVMTLDKKKHDVPVDRSVVINVCFIDKEQSENTGFKPGWYEWKEDQPLGSIVPKESTACLIVTWAGNQNYRRYIRNQAHINRKALRNGTMTQEEQERIEIVGMARYILRGWNGFVQPSPNGTESIELPYSEKNAVALLTNDEEFLNFVSELAQDTSLFEDDEPLIKNS